MQEEKNKSKDITEASNVQSITAVTTNVVKITENTWPAVLPVAYCSHCGVKLAPDVKGWELREDTWWHTCIDAHPEEAPFVATGQF